ncbi:serine/threonine-protein kinase DCLK3-like isoform X2 [Sebastes umbrosus]|uniref:serine/threonine-protein kinase DCLK3-like isoform X2 n=1 Tax=Sebastes umbrosus TaxID=72105 RepID=UPI00189E8A3A|nr:serine/threonine-protein kinase DCLK3-like isoform X2 [Sebastes umbrosus]
MSSAPAMNRTRKTRRLQRRTCPYTKTDWQHRTKVSEDEYPDTSLHDALVRLLKRTAREDEAGPSSSVDVHRENLISSAEDDRRLTETKDDKLNTAQNVPVHVQRELRSTSEPSSTPAMDRTRTTRRLKRRTCPYTKTDWQHRTKVSEGEHPDTSLQDVLVRLLKRTAREDEAGPSSSVDVHRENLISSVEDESKRKPDLDLTETRDDKLSTPQNVPAHVRFELRSTSEPSSTPAMDRTRTTSRLKRRTCPYTKTDWQHRTRVSEGEHPDTSLQDVLVRLLKRTAREDEAGPSSSVDVHRENLISSVEDESKRGGKRKLTDDEEKRMPDLDLTETRDDKLSTPQNVSTHVRFELPSTSEPSSAPAMNRTRTTRRPKRKACPYTKTVWQHRTKVSEGEHPDTSQDDVRVRLLKRTAREDEAGPSSSVDVHRENRISSAEDESKRGGKRRGKRGGKRKKKQRPDLTESEDGKLNTAHNLPVRVQRAAFEDKYQQQEKLGEGGCGSVFAGYRKADNLPVAIKYIPSDNQCIKHVDEHGNTLSVEVAILLKLAADTSGSAASSAPVSLLDWYDLEQELILVLERPVPCMDLFTYIWSKGGSLKEEEAKIILKQLVDALIDLEDKSIFHRDIKVENILIETGLDVPRVRLIDFGLSCFVKRGANYRDYYGTPSLIPPEWYNGQGYSAGPTTAWQVGVVLFHTLHRDEFFETLAFFENGVTFNKRMSKDCKDFLQMCLTVDPEQRLTLEQLKHHPWLR